MQRIYFPSNFLYTTAEGMCICCQGKGADYEVLLEQLIPDKSTTLFEVYERLKVTSGFIRILGKKYGTHFDTPFWDLPEEIQDEVVYGTYENGKQSYCIERILRNAFEKGEDVEKVYAKATCMDCNGERISDDARNVLLYGKSIGQLGQMTLTALLDFLRQIPTETLSQFSRNVIKDVQITLENMIHFRLGHLSLYRELSTLSGGELQRLFLHLHLKSELNSLIYVFDEPMAGLHPSEKQGIMEAIKRLRDIGNTVIVVEHDKEMICQADHIIEIGPKAGIEGGIVTYEGDYKGYLNNETILSRFLSGSTTIPKRKCRKDVLNKKDSLLLRHANTHYLKDVTVAFPLHAMVGVAGVSGSGKSSLIEETLLPRLASAQKYGFAADIEGTERISSFVKISQEPIGRSLSSTPASYIGIWDKIRGLFAEQADAKQKGLLAGHFSFHSKGACSDCGGSGYERIFLTSDFSVDKTCPTCHGTRYQKESLSVKYHGKTIAEVLELSVTDAVSFFEGEHSIVKPLRILEEMGMGYLTLGRPTSSLSGGEAQRVKLAKELGKTRKGNVLYIMDEPTTGLSLYDIALLMKLLDQLVENGNSVIVIEHNVEVLKRCDYIIELGPEGGDLGGQVIAEGTPMQLAENENSNTGRYLR